MEEVREFNEEVNGERRGKERQSMRAYLIMLSPVKKIVQENFNFDVSTRLRHDRAELGKHSQLTMLCQLMSVICEPNADFFSTYL